MKKILSAFCLLLLTLGSLQAQNVAADTAKQEGILNKKMYWGFSFVNTWSKIKGNYEPYFAKPTLGGGVKFDYYFTKKIGLSAGFNYQQRGSGIKTPDVDKSLGNADSTNRLRLRFNSLEVPIAVIYRSPNTLFGGEGVKFVASAGITPLYNFYTQRFFASVEDGFHIREGYTSSYYRMSACADASAGLLINAGEGAVLQVDALVSWGLGNVHRNSGALPTAPLERTRMAGIRLGFMF